MQNTGGGKLGALLREEASDTSVLWEIERSFESYTEASAIGLLYVGRKQAKHDLYAWAAEVADLFYEENQRHKQGIGVPKEYGGYGVRVRERSWTITIEWFYVEGRGKGRPSKVESIKGPGPNQYRIPKTRFSKAKNWELEAIAAAEDEFEKIRRCCEHLKAISNSAQGFEKIIRANRNV